MTNINATGNALQNDFLWGNSGNNVLNGLGGADVMRGGLGNDTYFVDNIGDTTDEVTGGGGTADFVFSSVSYVQALGIERLYLTGATNINATGNAVQNDFLVGNSGNNVFNGLGGNDVMRGGLGNDVLIGGLGNDTLTGDGGSDIFRFNTVLNAATNRDLITDFVVVDDTIQLENAIFAQLFSAGVLAANLFKDLGNIGAVLDGDDRIIYNHNTGNLSYDADGSGVGLGIQFATLSNHALLLNTDFVVI